MQQSNFDFLITLKHLFLTVFVFLHWFNNQVITSDGHKLPTIIFYKNIYTAFRCWQHLLPDTKVPSFIANTKKQGCHLLAHFGKYIEITEMAPTSTIDITRNSPPCQPAQIIALYNFLFISQQHSALQTSEHVNLAPKSRHFLCWRSSSR